MEDMLLDRRVMDLRPGVLSRTHLEMLAKELVGDVSMLVRFSPANASNLAPDKYRHYEEWYSK